MTKYYTHVGQVKFVSDDAEELRAILKRNRDRRVRAERERRERAIRKEIRDFQERYQDVAFRFGNATGLLCTFRPRDQQIIARWAVDEQFVAPKPVAFVSQEKEFVYE